jgi:hypothetical protein
MGVESYKDTIEGDPYPNNEGENASNNGGEE